jgi:ribosomal protein S27AE
MSLRQRIGLVYGIWIVGGPLILLLAAGLNMPLLAFFCWPLAGSLALYFARCPLCGKSVFKVERRRTMGFSIGYWSPKAERTCSRCGNRLLDDSEPHY